MRASSIVTVLLAIVALAGCGEAEQQATRTVTAVQTVTAPAPDPATVPEETPADPAAPAGEPLPSGVVAADGTYAMKTRRGDYEGENIAVEDESPSETEWVFKTTCAGSECTVVMRRELGSGAFKTLTLRPSDRPNVFEADSTGTTGCVTDESRPRAKQRYSIKLASPVDVGGRQTARVIDAYFTESTNGCPTKPSRGVVSWRGTLDR